MFNLAAGKSQLVTAKHVVPQGLAAGTYRTEITVTGAYEQCVNVTLDVRAQQRCACHVVQGDIPTRIRAHRWYDHFQCVEPCFEPAPQKKESPKRPDVRVEVATEVRQKS